MGGRDSLFKVLIDSHQNVLNAKDAGKNFSPLQDLLSALPEQSVIAAHVGFAFDPINDQRVEWGLVRGLDRGWKGTPTQPDDTRLLKALNKALSVKTPDRERGKRRCCLIQSITFDLKTERCLTLRVSVRSLKAGDDRPRGAGMNGWIPRAIASCNDSPSEDMIPRGNSWQGDRALSRLEAVRHQGGRPQGFDRTVGG
jgi:hypothetical protein